jgi:DNA-directed RNA polymerase specialized sigma24 family protein
MASNRPPVPSDRLEKAASKLRPAEREVLMLSAREGLSNAAIARRLGMPEAAAERLLADAVCALDRALERQERPWWRAW